MKRMTGFRGTAKKKPVYQDTTTAQAKAESGFIDWLQAELTRVEEFYKTKEKEALKRFRALEEQLVIMEEQANRKTYSIGYGGVEIVIRKRGKDSESNDGMEMDNLSSLNPFKERDSRADYERSNKYRKPVNRPIDQAARKRLKYACTEYYRRLEFLRSYVAINKEGFRKITKKFDKASGLGMSGRFMNNHVMRSYFGGMENKLDQLLDGTELLVAKYIKTVRSLDLATFSDIISGSFIKATDERLLPNCGHEEINQNITPLS
jgi:SPX domain protein involved in polyphosphate accumulation